VVLPGGALATKDFDRSLTERSHISLLDPDTLELLAPETEIPESAIARLSADGEHLYVVGVTTVHRFRWLRDDARLERDEGWSFTYRTRPSQSYGWDPVIAGGQVWFLDNGEHDYMTTMLGAASSEGPVHLIRVGIADASDHEVVEVCGRPRGAVTNPPLYDAERRIAVGYDSANGVATAWRFDGGRLEQLWSRSLATAPHLIRYPDTGEIVAGDFHDGMPLRGPRIRALARRTSRLFEIAAVRRAAARRSWEDVVVLDIETGTERTRARVPSPMQSVLFPAAGWERDFYYCSFSTLARVAIDPRA
jgi:hypothetical protein